MTITKDQMTRDIADRAGFYIKDVKDVLDAMDDLIKEYFGRVTESDDVSVQIVEGIKIGCKIVPERERVNPQNQEPIICKATVKPFTKYSEVFRDSIQRSYEEKNNG